MAALQSFGLRLGTAYQVYDDCLDLAGDEADAGKTLGTDLRKGKLTLPILNLLKAASPADLAVYSQMILRAEEPEAVALTAAARRSGALGEAVRTGVDLVLGARAELSILPETPHRAALQSLALRIAEQIGRFETGGK